ncbi:MAG: hypothetical protein M1836_005361 [Candelina mexicana]|nr:MAG: hypothetical protein M1836_005361 [Candelina mexicana]
MDSNLHFSNNNKAHHGPSRHENHDNHTPSQSTPFLQTDDIVSGSRHVSISSGNSPEKEGNVPQVHSWPDTASRLRKRTAWTYLSLLWAVIVTFLPVIILFLGFAVLGLDGNNRSEFGDSIIELGKYGATAFPIMFAAIAARLFKAVALWRSEKGAKLGLLEQLVGSQSLGATVERFVLLGRFDILGAIVVLLWFLSPLGSQMSLRLLGLTSVDIISQSPIQYFNTTTPAGSMDINSGPGWDAFDAASTLQYDRPSLTAFVSANMIASTNVLKSPVDQWNNIKVPRLDVMASSADASDNPWVQVANDSSMTWASLSGLMIQSLNISGYSTFIIQTAYIDVTCSDAMQTRAGNKDGDNSFVDMLKSVGLAVHINNATSPFSGGTEESGSASLFLDTNSKAFTRFDAPQNLFYASRAALVTGTSDRIEVYNCSYTTPKIEGNVTCVGQDCAITQVRRWAAASSSPLQPPFNWVEFSNLLRFIPGSLGYPHSSTASPVDQYMLGSDAPFSLGYHSYAPDFSKISGADFGKRLTTLINTVWQANLAPFSIPLGSSANFNAKEDALGWFPTATTTATIVQTFEKAKYAANRSHAIILIVITVVLQICAIVGLVLKEMTRAPDILGYVSTMTRDNVHTAVSSGGNTLDGIERARYLSDMRVQLADARPADDVGHIVLRSVNNGNESRMGRLDKRRLYI